MSRESVSVVAGQAARLMVWRAQFRVPSDLIRGLQRFAVPAEVVEEACRELRRRLAQPTEGTSDIERPRLTRSPEQRRKTGLVARTRRRRVPPARRWGSLKARRASVRQRQDRRVREAPPAGGLAARRDGVGHTPEQCRRCCRRSWSGSTCGIGTWPRWPRRRAPGRSSWRWRRAPKMLPLSPCCPRTGAGALWVRSS